VRDSEHIIRFNFAYICLQLRLCFLSQFLSVLSLHANEHHIPSPLASLLSNCGQITARPQLLVPRPPSLSEFLYLKAATSNE
jgi:hypothetical protein